jgi:hypothetical protein
MIREYIIASTLEARRRSAWGRLADTNIVGYATVPVRAAPHEPQNTGQPTNFNTQQLHHYGTD